MKVHRADIEQRMLEFQEVLRKAGMKMTHQRMEIFREVAMSGDHPDADKIHRRIQGKLPMVSLDTVYRTLRLLLELGAIDTLGTANHQLRFDGNMRPHHHFICKQCGLVQDFVCEECDQIKIPDFVKEFGLVETSRVEIRGLCLRCSGENKHSKREKRKKEES